MSRKFMVTTYHAPNKAYTRRVQDRSALRAQPWDPSEPMTIGHPIRWVLFQTDQGVIVQNLQGTEEHTTAVLDDGMLKKGEVSELPTDNKSTPLWIKVHALEHNASVLQPGRSTEEGAPRFRLVESFGNANHKIHWIRSATPIDTSGSIRHQGSEIARLSAHSSGVRVTATADGLRVGTTALKNGSSIELQETSALTAEHIPGWRWTFQRMSGEMFKDHKGTSHLSVVDRMEHSFFKRTLLGTGLGLLAFLGLSFLLPALFPPNEDELIPTQFAQVLMQAPAQPQQPSAPKPENNVAQAIQSQAVQNSVSQLLKGGMSKLLAQSDFVAGSRLQGAQSVFKTARSKNQTQAAVDTKQVQVATVGGEGAQSYAKGNRAGVKGQGGDVAALDLGLIEVEEGLSRDEVGKVIHAHMSEIRYCYESAMITNPTIEGKLIVDFTIGGQGQVTRAGVKQSTVGDGRVDDCIVRRLSRWAFPKPKGGGAVSVSYPFVFKAVGR